MIINFEGIEITLTQDPFIDGVAEEKPVYKAHGIGDNGKEYLVVWDVVEGYENITDESEMCDWDNPLELVTV